MQAGVIGTVRVAALHTSGCLSWQSADLSPSRRAPHVASDEIGISVA